MAEIFTVETRGIGKPDYSKEISLGRERPGMKLKYLQNLRIFGVTFTPVFSPVSWVQPPLAIGATASLIDYETGIQGAFTAPIGYTLDFMSCSGCYTEDAAQWIYYDGALFACLGVLTAGTPFYEAEIVMYGTSILDPAAVAAHMIDFQIVNNGLAALQGGAWLLCIQEAVGTPPLPTTKVIRCKFCGYEETVPRETTEWVCPKCGKLNIYMNLSKFKGTA